ncbi:hypothetical protein SAMN02983003_1272 [Devosia enhydra]|uniref:Protease inhibitor Inh n=1 Tax=Devosia enhydra TaxID=665118 RepID=A0A1K2HVW4_9HYPH|nr:hypothetical protein [Devosia enhydra]SFZ82780.1 hypothetical protein SAMN02983003_1272 [Devosia enhydra]
MTTKAALLALLALWGVGSLVALPAAAQETSGEEAAEDESAERLLTNRVWSRVEDDGLPGKKVIFLSDGTLVQDSCWETYRLSPWSMTSETALSWNEDGMDIPAEIVSISGEELVLKLSLVGGQTDEQRYRVAEVPYLCPDMPK